MRLPLILLFLALSHHSACARRPVKRHYSSHNYYVLEFDPHAGGLLDDIAQELGVEVVEPVGELKDHWLLRAVKDSPNLEKRDVEDRVLVALENLRSKAAAERDSSFSKRSQGGPSPSHLVSSIKYFSAQHPRHRVKRAPPPIPASTDDPGRGNLTSQDVATRLGIKDPLFSQQWHIVNDEYPQHMMNVTPLWDMGITGKGVISAMVDDGLDYKSPDLAANFDAVGSYDFNDHVDLPTPMLADDHHGTRCAGQIAAVKNDFCGIGLAYNSKVAGIRILSGPISDVDEAIALNYAFQTTSIYSCSWGPPDDGQSMEAPDYLIQKAVVNGIQNGRHGKGSVFVFASGNGAARGDQCNFDGYTNSIYSVTVAAIDHKGLHPYYSEPCAANLIVAYSSGSGKGIVTTDINDKCSFSHGGTSAAAPNAVGVFALALQVRPDLTWRDVQYLCIKTARPINPEDPDWEKTATGVPFSYKYGYGLLDAGEYVSAARNWKLVKPQTWISSPAIQINNGMMNLSRVMSGGEHIGPSGVVSKTTFTKEMLLADNFETLEHVTVQVWISHTRRGDVEVELISPNKIKSVLAASRSRDEATTGFPGWTFMSVKHWGENPLGDWMIRVNDKMTTNHTGFLHGWRITLWGCSIDPTKVKTYTVPLIDSLLPPVQDEDFGLPDATSSAKTHPKPTAHLPGDHPQAPGEKTKPAFSSHPTSTTSATASLPSGALSSGTSTPTPDEGWFAELSNLLSNRRWFFVAIGAVAVFGIAVGVFLWRRRRLEQRRRGMYTSLERGDDVAMSDIVHDGRRIRASGPRTKELYDAFGEVSDEDGDEGEDEDEDEDANEETALREAHSPGRRLSLGVEEQESEEPAPYQDEPGKSVREAAAHDGNRSPGSGSGDGSWVHASETQ